MEIVNNLLNQEAREVRRDELGALSGRLQAAVLSGACTRREARRSFFQALEERSEGDTAAAMELLGGVLEDEGLPISLEEYVLLTAAVATWRELAGRSDTLLRRDMIARTRASGLGSRLGISLYRRPPARGLSRRILSCLRKLRLDSGETRRSLSDLRRRWRQVRRMIGDGEEHALPS